MCTLTWKFSETNSGYTLLFNRDEMKTRKRAIPPSLKETDCGIRYLAPIDADAGGTWLAVNQFGLTVCLLNYYAAAEPDTKDLHSRGEVVVNLAGCHSIEALEQRLRSMPLKHYRGFEVVAIQNEARHWRWDTAELREVDAILPITSSSYDTVAVHKKRQEYFNSLGNTHTIETLKHFHSCHLDDNNQLLDTLPETGLAVNSVCMHREHSQTVSQSMVTVNEDEIRICYTDGSPCTARNSEETVMLRKAVA